MAWLAFLELGAGAAALGLGLVVLVASPRRADNRALALLLFVDGAGWLGIAGGLLSLGVATSWTLPVARFALAASPWLYGLFVVRALDVPLTRPLRRPVGTVGLMAMAVGVPLVLGPLEHNAAYQAINQYVGLVSGPHFLLAGLALVAALQWTRLSPDRRAARAYLDAFALRSVALLLLFGTVLVIKNVPGTGGLELLARALALGLLALHLGFLLYGILSGQVLGLDDKVRATLQKSLVVLTVAVIFMVMTEGAEMLLDIESPLLGLAAAVLIALSFLPIHGAAERLARRLLPGDARTPDMPRRERLDWLRTEAKIALADGRLGRKEQLMLESSCRRLGLSPADLDDALARARGVPDGQAGSTS